MLARARSDNGSVTTFTGYPSTIERSPDRHPRALIGAEDRRQVGSGVIESEAMRRLLLYWLVPSRRRRCAAARARLRDALQLAQTARAGLASLPNGSPERIAAADFLRQAAAAAERAERTIARYCP